MVLVGRCPYNQALRALRPVVWLLARLALREVPRHLPERRAARFAKLGDGEVHERHWRGTHRLAVQPLLLHQVVSTLSYSRLRGLPDLSLQIRAHLALKGKLPVARFVNVFSIRLVDV